MHNNHNGLNQPALIIIVSVLIRVARGLLLYENVKENRKKSSGCYVLSVLLGSVQVLHQRIFKNPEPPIPQVDHTLYIYSYILFVEIHFIICKFKTAKLSSAPDQMLVSVLCCVVDPGELRVMFFWLCGS